MQIYTVVGINITIQLKLTVCRKQVSFTVQDDDLFALLDSNGKHTRLKQENFDLNMECYLHESVSFVEAGRKGLFGWGLREYASAITSSCIKPSNVILYNFNLHRKRKNCRWNGSNPWVRFSPVSMAWTIDVDKVLELSKCTT
ncbi:unnamed protein product [Brassica rapa]|uniref:Uncharacterized protein n=1 Tax=Brassica campestris TaxID=3711 RepID=A0A3P5XYU5_BRACM|nr:unnamed protein product [Brassica rapa]VDC60292.1 unnamed protein product [Brassica rapa]